jgi:hypothetical protein
MTVTKQKYLEKVLQTHKMSHIEKLVDKHKEKRDEIKEKIEAKYLTNIYTPMNSGSFAKHTAINVKFDWDLVVPYKKNSFDTLEKMFDDVFAFLYDTYKDKATVRKQKVSIGLEFYADDDGDIINIDIVPGRELNNEQYNYDNKLNLYVNSKYGLIEEKAYLQTNIKAQIDHINLKNNERQIIRLLKIWKKHNNEEYKSFFLELFTIKAFEKETIEGNLWEKLKKVMEYIRNNVTKDGFTLKDPGNSSNNLMDTIDSYTRTNLSNKMKRMLDNIEINDDYLESYFPKNKIFEENEDNTSNTGYGFKTAGISASVPPNNTRFG